MFIAKKKKKNTQKETVELLKIRWLQVRADDPFKIYYCYSHNNLEEWKVLNVRKRSCGRPVDLGHQNLLPLYSGPHSLSQSKYSDLCELLQFIPPVYHEFYTSLKSTSNDISSSEGEDSEED